MMQQETRQERDARMEEEHNEGEHAFTPVDICPVCHESGAFRTPSVIAADDDDTATDMTGSEASVNYLGIDEHMRRLEALLDGPGGYALMQGDLDEMDMRTWAERVSPADPDAVVDAIIDERDDDDLPFD